MNNREIIAFNRVRSYTRSEVKSIAFRQGRDGIEFHPPSLWNVKHEHKAKELYEKFYALGKKWRARFEKRIGK